MEQARRTLALWAAVALLLVLLWRQSPPSPPPVPAAAPPRADADGGAFDAAALVQGGQVRAANATSLLAQAAESGNFAFVPYWERDDDARRAAADGPPAATFEYSVRGQTFVRRDECGATQVGQAKRLDRAFDEYRRQHAAALAGGRRGRRRFVHVGIVHKSSLQNSIKIATSLVLLGMITNRTALLSWERHLDPESVYWSRRGFDDLFDDPPINWTYSHNEYAQEKYDRYDVHGYGLEEYVDQEPIHRLFCSDIVADNTTWVELFWRYGYIGPLLWHSPYTHDLVAPLLAKEDTFGPLARKLFKPNKRMWQRIDAFRERHFEGYRVVALDFTGGRAVMAQMLQVSAGGSTVERIASAQSSRAQSVNRDIERNKDGEWDGYALDGKEEPEGVPAVAQFGGLVHARKTKVYVVVRDHPSMRTILRAYGNDPQLLYLPHRNFTEPGDEGELMDMFLMSFADVVYTIENHISTVGTFLSHRPRIVNVRTEDKRSSPDAICHPCLSQSGIEKTRCYNDSMAFPKLSYTCSREYPIF